MSQVSVLEPISESEYQAIESTIRETARGRSFLAEFVRRHRAPDAQALLGAVDRLEEAVERARGAAREPRVTSFRRPPRRT